MGLEKKDRGVFPEKFRKGRRKFLFFIILLIVIGLSIIIFNLISYYALIFGYDLAIRLSVDHNDVNLVNGDGKTIYFTIERITGIQCQTYCEYRFTDLSKGVLISNNSFENMQLFNRPISQEITAPGSGEGQAVYAFDLVCRNKQTTLCRTDGQNISRRTLITLEYTLSAQNERLRNASQARLSEEYARFAQMNETLQAFNQAIAAKNSFLINSADMAQAESAAGNFTENFKNELSLYTIQDYSSLEDYNLTEASLTKLSDIFASINKTFYSSIAAYNALIDNLSSTKKDLESLKSLALNSTQAEEANALIRDFNARISDFSSAKTMPDKQRAASSIAYSNLGQFVNQTANTTFYYANETIAFNLSKIDFNLTQTILPAGFSFPEQERACCLSNNCQACAKQEQYPIILLHGHNFNVDVSADNSINLLGKLESKLEEAGYLNAGEMYIYEPTRENPGLLGTIAKPIVLRASYYFDFLKRPTGYKSVQIKSENIDTYSIRLKEIIDNVKYETGSSKVIIIAHSMGGLVARRYLQVFGNESIDKMILIATPNKGISGKALQYCGLFGASAECNDMDASSLFINKLNTAKSDTIKIINIVGSGCLTDSTDGDGAVTADSSMVDFEKAGNIVLKGNCSGLNLFHTEILDTDKYPELFEAISNSLRSQSN